MSWQRCLFLRPFRFILQALRNRNSSQLAALSVHAVCAGWRRRTAGRNELFSPILARFSPAQQSLSVPLFAIVMEASASDLPLSPCLRAASAANAAPSPAHHVCLEGAVGFFGACASGWFYSLSISGRPLSANPRVIPASV